MTKEEGKKKMVDEVMNGGGNYYPIAGSVTRSDINDIFYQVAKRHYGSILVYCDVNTRLRLLEHFWMDSFTYVGTKINIIISEDFESNEISVIDGKPFMFALITDLQNNAIAGIETIQ